MILKILLKKKNIILRRKYNNQKYIYICLNYIKIFFQPINTKLNTTSSARRSQQLHSVHRQQSLLSMYGFEKKSKFNVFKF